MAQHQAAYVGLIWFSPYVPISEKTRVEHQASSDRQHLPSCSTVLFLRSCSWGAELAADRQWLGQGALPREQTVAARCAWPAAASKGGNSGLQRDALFEGPITAAQSLRLAQMDAPVAVLTICAFLV